MILQRENCINSLSENKIESHSGINIQELPYLNKVNLRINPKNHKYMSICGKILNTALPTKPNTYTKNQDIKIIWLGPDEWLISNEKHDDLFSKLINEISDLESSVTDVSENRTIIRISGEKIIKLLSKFLVLDIDSILIDEYSCAQTLFVKVPILLLRNNKNKQNPEFDIFVNRSHANYIYNLIVDGTNNLDY